MIVVGRSSDDALGEAVARWGVDPTTEQVRAVLSNSGTPGKLGRHQTDGCFSPSSRQLLKASDGSTLIDGGHEPQDMPSSKLSGRTG
jgi:hypothetical protein